MIFFHLPFIVKICTSIIQSKGKYAVSMVYLPIKQKQKFDRRKSIYKTHNSNRPNKKNEMANKTDL